MNNYNTVENLSEKEILNLYNDVVKSGEYEYIGVYCYMHVKCVNGYSNYIGNNHGGCCNPQYTTREDGCYSWHESFYAICGDCANYRSMYFVYCP